MKKRIFPKILKWFLIGTVLAILTFVTVVTAFFYFCIIGGPAKVTKDIDNYTAIFGEECLETGYISFPETIPEGTLETEFYHSYRLGLFDPTVETYLKCIYDETNYNKEIDRLENTSKSYGNRTVKLHKDEKCKFLYPAYVAIENAANGYEYALLTGENEITYIYTAYQSRDSVHFDTDYLPNDYMTEEGYGFGSGFSIYYANITESMIDTDYTRSPVYELTDGHLRYMGDDSFCVRVRIDVNGKEIITGCYYYDDVASVDNSMETEYTDLNGTEYISLEADRDLNCFVVTYLKEGTSNTRTFQK